MDRSFKEQFRRVRAKHHLSMGAVARHLGVSVPYVADVEHGRRPPFTKERFEQLISLVGEADTNLLKEAAMSCRPVELQPLSGAKAAFAHALAEGWNDLDDTEGLAVLAAALTDALRKSAASKR